MKDSGITLEVFDDNAVAEEIEHEYGVKPIHKEQLRDFDCVIIDVKNIVDKSKYCFKQYILWRLYKYNHVFEQ